jgi:hypothetical protein
VKRALAFAPRRNTYPLGLGGDAFFTEKKKKTNDSSAEANTQKDPIVSLLPLNNFLRRLVDEISNE